MTKCKVWTEEMFGGYQALVNRVIDFIDSNKKRIISNNDV